MSTKKNVLQSNHTKTQLSSQPSDDGITLPVGKRSQKRSLGTIAKLASDAQNEIKNSREEATIKRFKLQSQARRELPTKRVATCLRLPVPHVQTVDIVRVPSRDSAHFHGLRTCDSAWDCPVCASKLSERRRAEVLRGMVLALEHGLVPVLLTFTLSHNKWDTLEYLKDGLKSALRKFKEGRPFKTIKEEYGWTGSIMSVESTHGYLREIDNGWHIHRHDLVFLEPMSPDKFRQFEDDAKRHWLHCLEFLGYSASWEHGLDVTDSDTAVTDYITKWGHEPADTTWGVTHELTKASSKKASSHGVTPFQLLELASDGDAHAGALFREYSAAMATTSLIRWSRGFRAFLGMDEELTDEEVLAVEDGPTEVVVSMTKPTWYQIMNRRDDVRADLLIKARTHDTAALEEHIRTLVKDAQFVCPEIIELAGADYSSPPPKKKEEAMSVTRYCGKCFGAKTVLAGAGRDEKTGRFYHVLECSDCHSFTRVFDLVVQTEREVVIEEVAKETPFPAREAKVEEQLRLFDPKPQITY